MFKCLIKKTAALAIALLLTVLAGCGAGKEVKISNLFNEPPSVSKLGNITVKENTLGKLSFDEKNNVILLEGDNKIWATAPYDYYCSGMPSGRTKVVCTATVAVNYISKPGNAIKTVYTSDILSRGKISSERIENGIKVTYYFDNIKISIPVSYVLEDDYLRISVNTDEICEAEQKVYQIAIAPYFASVPNGADNGYLFIPSGSGALIKTDGNRTAKREYIEPVYGNDASIGIVSKGLNTAQAAIPVFGAKQEDSAVCGIIESGAEAASIVAIAGDESLGYSAVYPLFNVRGNNQIQINMIYDGAKQNTTFYSENIHSAIYSVRYYPLSGEKASYTAMAQTYRNYLKENGALSEKTENSPLYLRIIGGMMTDRLFAGIPYKKLKSVTTLNQAEKIISETEKETGVTPIVQLKGFGETGLDAGKIGGGFKIGSAFGDFSDLKAITTKYKETYLDFDLVNFTKSSNGLSKSAKTANRETAYGYDYDFVSGSKIEKRDRFKLLARSELFKAIEVLNKKAEKNSVNRVSLSSLANKAYSDYSSDEYAVNGGLEREVSKALAQVKADVLTEVANSYAAAYSKHVIESPTFSSDFTAFDAEIPFYQIVFKGYVSMSATEGKDMLLDAIESGIGLSYTVGYSYDEEFIKLPYSFSSATGVFDDIKKDIFEEYSIACDCLKKTANAEITAHEILAEGISKTVFSNGTWVVVNRTDKEFSLAEGVVAANSFAYGEEVRQ